IYLTPNPFPKGKGNLIKMSAGRTAMIASACLSSLSCLVAGWIEEHCHERVHALAAVAEADDVEPVHVLVDLALPNREELHVALAELRLARAAAEQDGERLARLAAAGESRLRRTDAEVALHAVKVGVDLVAPLRLRVHHVLHVHDAERDVPTLVLRGEAEHALVDFGLREHLTHAEHGLDEALADEVERRCHLGEVLRGKQPDGSWPRLEQADAVGQRALAEDVEVARFVHDLRREEERDLEVLAADVRGVL